MLNKVKAGIDSTMASIEDEILNEINMDGQDLDDIDEDFDEDIDDIVLDNDLPDLNLDVDVDKECVPEELNDYITSLQSQTIRLERELEECDDLLSFNPQNSTKCQGSSVMVYDDLRELQEAAAEAGMTVEEFREKLLRDIDEDDFDEEMMDNEYKEISELQMELEDARLDVKKLNDDIDEEVTSFLDERTKKMQGQTLAIKDGEGSSPAEDKEPIEEKPLSNEEFEESPVTQELSSSPVVENHSSAGPVVIAPEFTDFREFIRNQLNKTESEAEERRKQLRMMFEAQHQREEEKLLQDEEYRRNFQMEQEKEAEILMARKMEEEKRTEEEVKNNEKVLEEEYQAYQANMEQLNANYEEEKHMFETLKQSMMKELGEKRNKAAQNIQRFYRGYKTRAQMVAAIQELKEMKELRKKEKEQLRLMEIQYEIDLKAEQEKKKKEDKEIEEEEKKQKQKELEEQQEIERKKREEAERLAEEIRKEEEKKKEEEKQEEERKRKELELAKKEEEKRKKEEERQRKEEEKKRKEEEKQLKKEEAKRKQEEEKKRKEEEKKRKEEEKKKKEEEKRQREKEEKERKEEEKRKKEEGKAKEEEAAQQEEQKFLEQVRVDESTKKDSLNEEDKEKENVQERQNESFLNNNKNEKIEEKPKEELYITENDNLPSVKEVIMDNAPGLESSREKTPAEKPNPLGTLSPHPPPSPKVHDSTLTPPRHRSIRTPVEKSQNSVTESIEIAHSTSVTQEQRQSLDLMQKPKEPSPSELLRLGWMKSCTPWSKVSNEPWKLNQMSTAKAIKRPVSAKKKQAAIPESVVLNAAHAESLRQVSSMEVKDLPGYSLSTLSQCWNLRYLIVTQSHLICLDGLASCRHLLYIDAADNDIEYVDLKDLGSLQYLSLARNKLGSIHGLQGCLNLRWLDLQYNNIRKVADLSFLRRLHTLNLSHNQITSCEGLNEAVTLQELDLSSNFLQAFDGVNRLCLLTSVNLASNNLLQPPVLRNQVLLQWLHIQENSIQSLAPLGQYWLPLLHCLEAGSNRFENLHGLDNFISLSTLDVSHNQLPDVASLNVCLQSCLSLKSLAVVGNPLVDVQESEYRDLITDVAINLQLLDGESVGGKRQVSFPREYDESVKVYHQQIEMHTKLRQELESQTKQESFKATSNNEGLCSTIFNYCDMSFKMAVEHRSSHEYGDIHMPSSTSSVATTSFATISKDSVSDLQISARTDEYEIKKTNHSSVSSSQSAIMNSSNMDKSKSKFDTALAADGQVVNSSNQGTGQLKSNPSKKPQNNVTSQSNSLQDNLNKPVLNAASKNRRKSSAVDSSTDSDDQDDEDGEDLVDVTKDHKPGLAHSTMIPHQSIPMASQQQSYLNEKDKFLMALEGGSTSRSQKDSGNKLDTSHHSNQSLLSNHGYPNTGMSHRNENGSNNVHHNPVHHSKNLFDAALSGEVKSSNPHTGQQGLSSGVKANVVGSYMDQNRQENDDNFGDPELDAMIAEDFDMDCMDFDFDKYLDVGELDEFLEKGWRPEDSPQFPASNYPILGKINHHPEQKRHSVPSYQDDKSGNFSSMLTKLPTPPPPPSNPHQAWRDDHNNNLSRQMFSPSQNYMKGSNMGIPPLPNPSPSPSTVASAAETLGGGSVKSKKKDELCEEWGFKDGRTAELMMARAKKMKYNSERKKKLSKLNPQQRYQLFQKLEESGKIQQVRPQPAKVLPRKEYFKAREEEVQRQDFERRLEEKTRVHRTFEWLHTQVGDHPVSTSRINPVPGPVYSNQDMSGGHYTSNTRQFSPSSDHNSPSKMTEDYAPFTGRRYSVGDASNPSRSPLLPPISISSAPSQPRKEKMSFRNETVELSGGWGGGKKRNGKR